MAYKTNLHRLVESHFNVHTDPNFEELGILKFNYIHLLHLDQFIYSPKIAFLYNHGNKISKRFTQADYSNTKDHRRSIK